MKYETEILNKLLDKFENSQQAWDIMPEGRRPRKIALSVEKDPVFSKYWDEDCYLNRPDYLAAVKSLGKKGFVQYRIDRESNLLIEVILCVDNVDDAFSSLGRQRKRDQNQSDTDFVKQLLVEYHDCPTAFAFLSDVRKGLDERKPLSSYCTDREELALLGEMVVAISGQQEDILLRNFSKRFFQDSKILEQKSSRLLTIFNGYSGTQYEDFRSLCDDHHIVLNPEVALVKGPLMFSINGQSIDLRKLGFPFSLTAKAIDAMHITSLPTKRVVTIENLTTFHYFDDPNALVIYLGGYHNSAIRNLLLKLKPCAMPKTRWFHTGDIDWGGFNILIDLRRKTSLPFVGYRMGVPELQQYKSQCKPLTAQDKKNLQALLDNPEAAEFSETITYMLMHDYKLEQESIEYDTSAYPQDTMRTVAGFPGDQNGSIN